MRSPPHIEATDGNAELTEATGLDAEQAYGGDRAVLRHVMSRARDIVAEGWCQHTEVCLDGDTEQTLHCAVGALRTAAWEHPEVMSRTFAVEECAIDLLDADDLPDVGPALAVSRLARWNDADGRTQDEVLALYDRALLPRRG